MGTLVKGKFAIIAVTAVLILCVTSQIALVAADSAYQDEFNSTALQSGWTFTNPNGGSYSLDSGYLTITAKQNSRMGTSTTSNVNAPRMVQTITGDFAATTYVTGTFSTTAPNYRGGILLWKNSTRFIALEKWGGDQAMIYSGELDKYQPSSYTASTNLYLKMVKSGTTVTGYYSTDGNTWTLIGTYSFPYGSTESLQLGLFTFNGDAAATTSSFSAKFDFFRIDPHATLSVLPEYPVGVFGAAAAITGGYVFFKEKNRVQQSSF